MKNYRGHCYYGNIEVYDERRHYEAVSLAAITTTLAVVGVAASVAATGISTYAAVQNSRNQAKLAASVQQQKEVEAANTAESFKFEETQARRRTGLLMGKQAAILAASGVDITSGTPLIQEIDIATQSELNALNTRRIGRLGSEESLFESRIARFQRDTAKGAIPYEISAGVLSGVSEVSAGAGQLYSYGNVTKKTTTSSWYKG